MATSKDSQNPKRGNPTSVDAELHGDKVSIGDAAGSLFTKALIVGAAGLGLAAVLGVMEGDSFRRFSFAYLTAYVWALTIGLGGLFWVTLQHLVNAKWSISLRRLGELLANTVPVLGILSLPVVVPALLGNDTLYEWANHAHVEADHVLHHKAKYLSSGFFLIRFLAYFIFWSLLARYFLKASLEQDKSGAADSRLRMQRVAGPAMIAFGLTITFASIDLIMTLEPHFYSTIFGVYYFASAVLAVNSTLVLVAKWLQKHGRLTKSVTVEHYHDLGKMMFAFIVFWAYIGFSQYMLIWYANLPEETFWYKQRFAGQWRDFSWALLFLHFVIPFFGLLSRHVKRNGKTLVFWAFWVLAVVYFDMYWLVLPVFSPEVVPFAPIDLLAWIGMAGVLVAAIAYRARQVVLVPVKDPLLERSLAFENI